MTALTATFSDWKLRNGMTTSEDPDGKVRAEMELAWNGAVEAAIKFLESYARRYDDIRTAALESAAENLRYMLSPRTCSCCGQKIIEDRVMISGAALLGEAP